MLFVYSVLEDDFVITCRIYILFQYITDSYQCAIPNRISADWNLTQIHIDLTYGSAISRY